MKLQASGRLGTKPEAKTSKAGKGYTRGFLLCAIKDDGDDFATMPINLTAFGQNADLLAGCVKGQMVDVMGSLSQWTNDSGKVTYQLVIESMLASAKPKRSDNYERNKRPDFQARVDSQKKLYARR